MLQSLEAHILLHKGNQTQAIYNLQRIEWPDEKSDQSHLALTTLYHAIEGSYGLAERGIDELARTQAYETNTQVRGYLDLAWATIQSLDLESGSYAATEDLAEKFRLQSNHQLELYTRELLLVRAIERGKKHLGQYHYRRAQFLRRRLGLAQTSWDAIRLTPYR